MFIKATLATLLIAGLTLADDALAQEKAQPASTHTIGAAKLIIGTVKENRTFYEQMFGMKEVAHYDAKDIYDEPIMGFSEGARLALFSPLAEAPIQKSQYPVVLFYTPNFDVLTKRLEDAKYSVRRLPASPSVSARIAIVKDPSGNSVEIVERAGKLEVGGSKLIVDNRQKAEDFYVRVFGVQPGKRYVTDAYDEVLMNFGGGPFLALFQPKSEAPLPKSQYPVVAIYTTEFDAVKKRIEEAGLGYRTVKSSLPNSRIIVAKDPAGNAIEIISR